MVNVSPPPVLVVRPHDPRRQRRRIALWALLWIVSLLVVLGVGHLMQGQIARVVDHSELIAAQHEIETLKQNNAALERAEQVARAANADLQQTLRDHQEQIAGLRADLAFFSRLTGGAGRREGLNVHGVHVQPGDSARVYNVIVTLTQNLKTGQLASGHVRISMSGVRDGKLATLGWSELAPDKDAGGLAFSFKYFEQIKAVVMLPGGFVPNRVRVEADAGSDMGRADQDFAWSEALAAQEVPDVQQQP
jgi:FtsZ-binding cell division protein ZapB